MEPMMRWRRIMLAGAGMLLLGPTAHAQDAQYWAQKYGTRGLLLNGVVLGSAVDLSTTFYNPGGLALLPDSISVIAVKAFDFSTVTIQHATGTGEDVKEPRNTILPTFFGGTVSVRFAGSSPLAYSLFPRQTSRFNLTAQSLRTADVIPSAPGAEDVVSVARFEEDLDETWGGVTWSRKLGGSAAIGLSQYIAVRSQRSRRELVLQALADDSTAASALDVRGFSYNDYRAVTKIGLAFEFTNLKAGITLTSPGLHISGSGDAGWDRFRSGVDVDGDGQLDNQLIASFQEGVAVKFKSPPAIGAGVSFELGRTTVHLSAESFDAVKQYSVFETAPAVDTGTGQQVAFQFVDEREGVFNYGVGLEHHLGAVSAVFASFSTDFSSLPHGRSDLAIADWDAHLITTGMTVPVGRSEFTLGLGYGFGEGEGDRLQTLPNPAAGSALQSTISPGGTTYRNWRLIFGFTL
jgi:hypothetical protein